MMHACAFAVLLCVRVHVQDQTESLKKKLQAVEEERDHLRANEQILEEKVCVGAVHSQIVIGTVCVRARTWTCVCVCACAACE